MKTPLTPLIIALLISAGTVAGDEDEPYFDFRDWEKSHKLNTELLESEAHDAYIDIYLNDAAYETYATASAPYAVGSVVYKPLYLDANRSSCVRLVVMVKMAPGYDAEHGDWWYGVYDKSGAKGWHRGRIPECIKCHEYAKAKDYMFSESVLYKIKHPGTMTTTTGEIVGIP